MVFEVLTLASLNTISAGSRILASVIAAVAPKAALKTTSQSFPNTTLANDSQLYLALPANSAFVFLGLLSVTGAAISTGDLKMTFTVPSGASISWEAIGYSTTTAGPLNGNSVRAAGGVSAVGVNAGSATPVLLIGSITMGSTAGTVQLQEAQSTSNGTTPTVVQSSSFLAGWQVA